MLFKSLSLLALAVSGAVAQQLTATDEVGKSVLLVLATAIPSSELAIAIANPTSFASELASSLNAGETPSWYQALPSDVKSYLPQLYPAAVSATATETPASSSPLMTPSASGSGLPTGGNSTRISTVSSATLKSTGGANSQTPTTSSTAGAAPYPTAVVGAGLAGVVVSWAC